MGKRLRIACFPAWDFSYYRCIPTTLRKESSNFSTRISNPPFQYVRILPHPVRSFGRFSHQLVAASLAGSMVCLHCTKNSSSLVSYFKPLFPDQSQAYTDVNSPSYLHFSIPTTMSLLTKKAPAPCVRFFNVCPMMT